MRAVTRREAGVALLGLAALAACSGEAAGAGGPGLETAQKKEIAMRLVSSAENSSLDWRAQYRYIEDIGDGRGYTAGIIGFCSGTGDMLALVERYARERAGAELAGFLPALREVRGSASHRGLGGRFTRAWQRAAEGDRAFRDAQDGERDRVYFDPAVARGRQDGLGALGQFCYYDARVMHGHGDAPGNVGFATIRRRALDTARPPSRGGDETAYLHAFLDARVAAIAEEPSHTDTSRIDTAQRVFLREANLRLDPPLVWKVYGDTYRIEE
ncbi:chitosanase [Streptomyces sp. CAI-21]|nr:chitosanase [Streptomyces sp. CAI-21]